MDPTQPQHGPSWRVHLDCSMTTQTNTPFWPNMTPNIDNIGPKQTPTEPMLGWCQFLTPLKPQITQRRPNMPQHGPNWPQNGPRQAKHRPNIVSTWPNIGQTCAMPTPTFSHQKIFDFSANFLAPTQRRNGPTQAKMNPNSSQPECTESSSLLYYICVTNIYIYIYGAKNVVLYYVLFHLILFYTYIIVFLNDSTKLV